MCGVMGIISKGRNVLSDGIVLLNAENHRGEQACGAAVFDGRRTRFYRGPGLVAEVFGARDQKRWSRLEGFACVMQVLYSTIGKKSDKEQLAVYQPAAFKFRGTTGAVSYNGNLVNLGGLRAELKDAGYKFKSEVSDTEVITASLSVSRERNFLHAFMGVLRKIEGKGAFSLAVLYGGKIYGVRDQNAIRPLCIIKKSGKNSDADSYILASESCVFPSLEATRFIREVGIGELVVLSPDGIEKSIQWTENIKPGFCISEFIYFANPASRFFGVSVYAFRVKSGEVLAKKHPVKAHIVVPIPDSARGCATGFSRESGIPQEEGVIKNRYASRTFMAPRHVDRRAKQRAKLQVLPDVMEGRNICFAEDSIYRASVAPAVVKMAREHGGARSVHVRVASPPVKHTCHLGLDTSTKEELIASAMSINEIRDDVVLCDSLEYLTVPELKQVLIGLGLNPCDFCFGCFKGEYPTPPQRECKTE